MSAFRYLFQKYIRRAAWPVAWVAFFGGVHLPLTARAADIKVSTESDRVISHVSVEGDFDGTEASVLSTDANTIEIRIMGAQLGVDGKKQLFRFENGVIKVASLSQDGSAGIVRFALREKNAAVLADQLVMARENGGVRVEFPSWSFAESANASSLQGVKTVAIPTGVDDSQVSEVEESGETTEPAVTTAPRLVASASAQEKSENKPQAGADTMVSPGVNSARDEKKESEIPVLTTLPSEKKAAAMGLEKLVVTLAVLCTLLAGALFGIKRWAKKKSKPIANTKIQVLTQHYIGPKKSIAIIQVAGEALLVGITDHNISMLKTLALIDDEVPGVVPRNFSDELESDVSGFSFKKSSASTPIARDDDEASENEVENFAMKGLGEVRDLVSTRLKTLRNLQ